MSEIIIQTIKDILTNQKFIIENRYKGDFEFQEFKKHIQWQRHLLLFLYVFLTILSIIVSIKSLRIIYVEHITKSFLIILQISGPSLILGFGIFLFSIYNLYVLICINWKHLKIIRSSKNKIDLDAWKKWQFRDIIFSKPKPLSKGKEIIYRNIKSSNYIFYLILQYQNGSFGWYAITNNKELTHGKERVDCNKFDNNGKLTHFEIIELGEKLPLKHEDIIAKMEKKETYKNYKNKKMSITFYPKVIVGIRIRANIENKPVKIKINLVNKNKS